MFKKEEKVPVSMTSTSFQAFRGEMKECMSGEPEDEFTHFGRTLASQFRQLPLPIAVSIQNKIQNIIHEERMKILMEQSSTSNCSLPTYMADQLSAENNVESATKNFAVIEKHDTCHDNSKVDLDSYPKFGALTSGMYKIELGILPYGVKFNAIRIFLNHTLKSIYCKLKPKGRPPVTVFLTFKNAVDRDEALKILHGHRWKDKVLSAKIIYSAADPMVKKRIVVDHEDCPSAKKIKRDISSELRLKDSLVPDWTIPYEEQLKKKEEAVEILLFELGNSILNENKNSEYLIKKNRMENSGLCCPLIPIKPSPVTTAYRNYCKFTVGRHLYTKEKTVGFDLIDEEDSMCVAEPDDCINISKSMLRAVKSFQEYIRLSEKDVYNPETDEGFWNHLIVRTSSNSDVSIIIVMHPQTLSEDGLEDEKCRIKEYYEKGAGSTCGVTSMYFQLHAKRTSFVTTPEMIHLMGSKVLEETFLGLKFKMNPKAFFPINVPAAEVTHSVVADFVLASPAASVLDICYKNYTTSLCLAKAGRKVINVGMDPKSVKNAIKNAEFNNLSNVEFLDGNSAPVIVMAIQKCDSDNIIAIVDSPDEGFTQTILKVIREDEKILKFIFVSGRPDAAFRRFVELCRAPTNIFKGSPFYPVQAAVVDMYPYTCHKELVLVFERQKL